MNNTYSQLNSDNLKDNDINFFKELYTIMKKYNVHRIYTIHVNNKKLISTQQLLCIDIEGKPDKVFDIMEKYLPWIYFNIFCRCNMIKYKLNLKNLLSKYNIKAIGQTTFSLYQGINIFNDSLCIRGIDLEYKDGQIFHIDNLYLDI